MDGQPVWLASLSLNGRDGKKIAVPRWNDVDRAEASGRLTDVLLGAGDVTRERFFRMNITMCLHRAATDAEIAIMPAWFHTHPAVALAGGPVEILTETVPGADSTKPCRAPKKGIIDA